MRRRVSGVALTYGILLAKNEAQTVDLSTVYRVIIEDSYIHLPFSEIVCFGY